MLDADHLTAGDLHHRAELQIKSEPADGIGGVTVTWSKERDLWCNITDVSGRMALEAIQRESQLKTDIFARFNADITTEKRITHDGKTYMIEAAMRRGKRKEWVHIIAQEGVAT